MTDDPFLAPPGNTPQQPPAPPAAPEPYQPPAGYTPEAPVQPSYPQQGYAQPGYAPQGYAQPGYPVPMPPPMPYAPYTTTKPKTWMNWVAFGCGLGALFTCVSFIPAIIFGHLGLAAAKRGEADARGAGITGLVFGYLFLVIAIAYVAFIVVLGVSGGFDSSGSYD